MKEALRAAGILREIGSLLRFHGASRFRSRAYARGADALERLRGELAVLLREDRLESIPGIGPALSTTIREIVETGRSRLRDRLALGVPREYVDLAEVRGLGRKQILKLHRELGIESIDDLRRACEDGRVRAVRGFGEASERRIRQSLDQIRAPPDWLSLRDASELGAALTAHLATAGCVVAAAIAGDTRRRTEVTDRVRVVVASDDAAAAIDHLRGFSEVIEALPEAPGRWMVRLGGGRRAELVVVAADDYVRALHRETGSPAHVAKLAALAALDGIDLDAATSEAAIYESLQMPFIPPELREDEGEIEAARAGRLPAALVEQDDVRGLVHCHTTASDGKHTIAEMADAAQAMGMEYLTITDHSPTASYAGGLDVDRLRRQWDEIDRVQERVGVRLLRGTESDILADGSLDYPACVLERLDVVIASIHSRLRMDRSRMTERLVRAMRQPCFKIWGHALGRLIGHRDPIDCDVERVLETIAESRAAIEINGDPSRLDLAPPWVRRARALGIPFVLSTDAHSTRGLGNVRFAVDMARRGWITRAEVLNTRSADQFREAVRPAA